MTSGVAWTQARYGVRQKRDAVLARPAHLVRRAWALELPGSDHIPVLEGADQLHPILMDLRHRFTGR